MSQVSLTDEQISEGIQYAAAATRHWLEGDHEAAFSTIKSSESFGGAVYGLLAISGIAVLGSGKDPARFLSNVAVEEQLWRLKGQEGTDDE